MQPLQTISSACVHVDFRQVVSAFFLALCPFFFLRGFIALNTFELSIIRELHFSLIQICVRFSNVHANEFCPSVSW